MLILIARRLLLSAVTLTIVAVVVFTALELLPGDWATAYFGREATPERLEALRAELGLDRPATERFADWFSSAVRGDLGNSLARQEPVAGLVLLRLRNSLLLGGLAGLVANSPTASRSKPHRSGEKIEVKRESFAHHTKIWSLLCRVTLPSYANTHCAAVVIIGRNADNRGRGGLHGARALAG